MDFVLQWHSCA